MASSGNQGTWYTGKTLIYIKNKLKNATVPKSSLLNADVSTWTTDGNIALPSFDYLGAQYINYESSLEILVFKKIIVLTLFTC